MAIRSFAGSGGANTLAQLSQRNLMDATQQLGLINQGLQGIGQFQPQAELRNLMATTNRYNYADNIGLMSSLASQSSKPYQEQAVAQQGQLDALTGRGIQQGNLDLGLQTQNFAEQQAPILAQAKVDAAKQQHLYNLAEQRNPYEAGDIVKNQDGTYSRVTYDQYNPSNIKLVPSTEDAYNKLYGIGGKSDIKYETYVNPSDPTGAPMQYPVGQNPKGTIPLSDASAYKSNFSDVTRYIGTDNKPLSENVSKEVENKLMPLIDPQTKDAAVSDIFNRMSEGIFNIDTQPTAKQAEAIKTSIGEMALDKKYGFNLYNSLSSPSELLALVNKYREDKGLTSFKQEPWYERIISKFPFGSKGLETIKPKSERDLVNLYIQSGGYDQSTTKPDLGLNFNK